MKKPNRNQLNTVRPSVASGSGRQLLLEQLENRQLLAGDLAQMHSFDELKLPASSSPGVVSIVRFDSARMDKAGSAGSAGRGEPLAFQGPGDRGIGETRIDGPKNSDLHRSGASSSMFSGQKHSPIANGVGRGVSSPSSHSAGLTNSVNASSGDLNSLDLLSQQYGSDNGRALISSRLTEAAVLPALPPGFELIERITVTQSPSVPLGSNTSAAPSTTDVLVLKNNNKIPSEVVTIVSGSDAEIVNQISRVLNSSSRSGLDGEGEGPSRDQAGQPTFTVVSEGISPGAVDSGAATTALDDVLSEYFGRDAISADQIVEQIHGYSQAQVASHGEEVSLAAFFDSISGELRRSGMSRAQIAELESLLKQIIEADPAVRGSGTFVATQHASWVQYSRRGVQVYDFSGDMMAVPVDGSSLPAGPLDSIAGMASNAWTQRFGLADIALVELASFVDGTELGAQPLAELDGDTDAPWDLLPAGLISQSWRSAVGKASLVAAACLATTRLHQRSTARSLATDASTPARPRHPR